MKINTRSSVPIPISIAGKDYLLKTWKREDWKAFGAKLDADRVEQATAHLTDPVQKAKAQAYFPLAPLTFSDLRQHAQSVDGIYDVVRLSLAKEGIGDDVIGQVLDNAVSTDIEGLAFMLVGFISVPEPEKPSAPPDFTSGQQPASTDSAPIPTAT